MWPVMMATMLATKGRTVQLAMPMTRLTTARALVCRGATLIGVLLGSVHMIVRLPGQSMGSAL